MPWHCQVIVTLTHSLDNPVFHIFNNLLWLFLRWAIVASVKKKLFINLYWGKLTQCTDRISKGSHAQLQFVCVKWDHLFDYANRENRRRLKRERNYSWHNIVSSNFQSIEECCCSRRKWVTCQEKIENATKLELRSNSFLCWWNALHLFMSASCLQTYMLLKRASLLTRLTTKYNTRSALMCSKSYHKKRVRQTNWEPIVWIHLCALHIIKNSREWLSSLCLVTNELLNIHLFLLNQLILKMLHATTCLRSNRVACSSIIES